MQYMCSARACIYYFMLLCISVHSRLFLQGLFSRLPIVMLLELLVDFHQLLAVELQLQRGLLLPCKGRACRYSCGPQARFLGRRGRANLRLDLVQSVLVLARRFFGIQLVCKQHSHDW